MLGTLTAMTPMTALPAMTRGGMALVSVVVLAGCGGDNDAESVSPVAPSAVSGAAPAPAPSPSAFGVCGAIGTTPGTIRSIINGQACSPGASSVVSLRIVEVGGEDESLCTGTAIASDAVLTAAHCLPAGAELSVVAGGRTIAVTSTHPVASFSEDDEGSLDVGVVRTAGPIGQPTLPILTSRDAMPGEEGVIAGYGLDNMGADSALKAGTMVVARVNANFIIANFSGMGSNTCSGDSGGPLLLQHGGEWVIAGVTSGGTGGESCQGVGASDFANLRNGEAIALISLGTSPGSVENWPTWACDLGDLATTGTPIPSRHRPIGVRPLGEP